MYVRTFVAYTPFAFLRMIVKTQGGGTYTSRHVYYMQNASFRIHPTPLHSTTKPSSAQLFMDEGSTDLDAFLTSPALISFA